MSLVRMLHAMRLVPAIYPKETGATNRLAATLSVNAPFSLPHVGRLILRESMTRLVFVPANETLATSKDAAIQRPVRDRPDGRRIRPRPLNLDSFLLGTIARWLG